MALAVSDHPLKFGAVVAGATDGTVYVLTDYGVVVGFGIIVSDIELALNGLLGLGVAGKTRVDDDIQSSSPASSSTARLTPSIMLVTTVFNSAAV